MEFAFRRLVEAARTLPPPEPAPTLPEPPPQRTSTLASDRMAIRNAFEDLVMEHVGPLRNLMLEVQWGTASLGWLHRVRPVLHSLRTMASAVALDDLREALDGLTTAFDRAISTGGSSIRPDTRLALLAAYSPLGRQMPKAFAIDREAARREPLIVEALLAQVPGLDPMMLGKFAAVGLTRLTFLLGATADEIAELGEVPRTMATAIADLLADFRRSATVGVTLDTTVTRRQLEPLLIRLDTKHQSFERAASGWSEQDVLAKRRARRERERAYLALKVVLARLGELDFLLELDKMPYGRRIEHLARFVHEPVDATILSLPDLDPLTSNPEPERRGHGRAHA